MDGDGWIDLYVANDHAENQLWINRHDGTFQDDGLLSGSAVNSSGEREASMGVDVGDADGDGVEDLIVAHMDGESNTLYLNDGRGVFLDRASASGLAAGNLRHTTYAAVFIDVDNDGSLDVFNANGAMQLSNEWAPADAEDPLPEPNQLYLNLGGAHFIESSAAAGDAVLQWHTSRSAVLGDIDNDGDTDVLVTNSDGPTQLLSNLAGNSGHWIGLRLTGTVGHRDMLGATVTASRPDGSFVVRRVRTDGGYLSANDPRILIGLGNDPTIESIEIKWPDGSAEAISGWVIDSYTTVDQNGS